MYLYVCVFQVEVNTEYIPLGQEESYSRERPGKPLESLVPIGKTPEQFVDNLKTKFKSVRVLLVLHNF